eukprot:SAG31_NODE_7881_length_1574_cov_9.377627_2_plen_41_part_01
MSMALKFDVVGAQVQPFSIHSREEALSITQVDLKIVKVRRL